MTCNAKLGDLMTSTDETRESMIREVRSELSREMAFALPSTRMTVERQREIRMD